VRRRADVAIVLVAASLAAGCPRSRDAMPDAGSTSGSATPIPSAIAELGERDAGDAALGADAGAPAPEDDTLAYTTSAPRGGRSIGHTSVVFKIELSSGKKAAFKPASRRGSKRYKGEIAAYRLGVALGIPNVPRAYFRTFKDPELAAALGSPEIYGKEILAPGGIVKGAIIPWIDKLEFLPLESEPLWSQFRGWLKKDARIPDEHRETARQASTMVAFDFITGNWDRWSGGNVGLDRAKGNVLFIDNDGAFFEIVPRDALAKSRKLIAEIDRWSALFVGRVRALSDDALAKAIGEESDGVPLLSGKALAGVYERRAELLRTIDAKIGDAGEADTLFFP
jgi:hypothetical protein